jgi:hypothetical protein
MQDKFFAWIKIIRLHYYSMTWITESMGAMAASTDLEK